MYMGTYENFSNYQTIMTNSIIIITEKQILFWALRSLNKVVAELWLVFYIICTFILLIWVKRIDVLYFQ